MQHRLGIGSLDTWISVQKPFEPDASLHMIKEGTEWNASPSETELTTKDVWVAKDQPFELLRDLHHRFPHLSIRWAMRLKESRGQASVFFLPFTTDSTTTHPQTA